MKIERVNEGEELRKEVIELRDEALKQGSMDWAVRLSHVILWMDEAVTDLKMEAEW